MKKNFHEVANNLKAQSLSCPKTIIYCNTIAKTTEIGMWLRRQLQDKGKVVIGESQVRYLVEWYSKVTDEVTKKRFIKEFRKPESFIRVMVATIAFGLGIDIPNVRYVYIMGLPSDISTLWQEIGRAGRDGLQASAVILQKPFILPVHIFLSVEHKFDLPEGECIKKFILSKFLKTSGSSALAGEVDIPYDHSDCFHICRCELCTCCSYCRNICTCDGSQFVV